MKATGKQKWPTLRDVGIRYSQRLQQFTRNYVSAELAMARQHRVATQELLTVQSPLDNPALAITRSRVQGTTQPGVNCAG
jgi:hypothetical protein